MNRSIYFLKIQNLQEQTDFIIFVLGVGFLVNIISCRYFCTIVTERKEFSNLTVCQIQDITNFETRTSTSPRLTYISN